MTAPTDTARLLKAARLWYEAGCCVVPAAADGTKRPFGQWKTYQHQRPSWPVLESWLKTGDYDGIGLICGAVSGNLEMFEIEGRAGDLYNELGMRLVELGYAELWFRLDNGYSEQTPSGGYHFLMRVGGAARPNLRLARRPATEEELRDRPEDKVKVLLETRGQGGFTVVSPSGGRTHPLGAEWTRLKGTPAEIPLLTEEERDVLHVVAASFDQMPEVEQRPAGERRERQPGDPLRPGDDFDARATWQQILEPHGWTYCYDVGGAKGWRRPGKTVGISATTGRNNGDNLYVFSSSTPFETEKPYSKFAAYALLEHGGDFSAAARALGRQGYGERASKPTPAAQVAAPEPSGPATLDDDGFWDSREILRHIHLFARSRQSSPWAVLGVVLARVITATPPFIVLPPLVGSRASVNLFVALVGPSGGGKGAAEGAAGDAVEIAGVETATVGSGEGIGHLYAHRQGQQVIRDRDAVLFTVPEVDNLAALGARQGATLLPALRSAWSGEKLGFAYADPKKALPIERHTYRMGLVLGVQPGRAGALLDDADGGTPQRFLWMPTGDPGAPDVAPAEPLPWRWALPDWQPDMFHPTGLSDMEVPESARRTIAMNRLLRLRGEGDPLDGHSLLARLKAAAALALLDQRRDITEGDWRMSAQIMAVSDATRESVVAYLREKNAAANTARGEAEAHRAVVVEDRVTEQKLVKVSRRIAALLAGGPAARSEIRRKIAQRDREHFEEALERVVAAGQVVVTTADKGDQLALAP